MLTCMPSESLQVLEGELWLLNLCPNEHGMRSPCRSFFLAPPCLSHSAAGSVHVLVWLALTFTPPKGNLQPPEGKLVLSSVQSLSHIWLFATPWTAACQASLSITNSQSLLKLMSIESVMPSNHLILCHPLLLLPSIFPSIRVFQWVKFSQQVAKVLEFQLQHQSFQWIFRTDFL